MTPALTPQLALGYLREMSADVRGGVVLNAGGEAVAGDAPLAAAAAAVLAVLGGASEGRATLPDGAVLAARGDGLALVVVYGPRVMPGLARHDVRQALADLGAPVAGPPETAPPTPAVIPAALAEALISAAQRGPGE